MAGRRQRERGSSLFALYVLASLVPISVIGAVLTSGYHEAGLELGRDQGRAQAGVIGDMVIAPAVRGADLSLGLSGAEHARLQAATDLAIFEGSVSHLRLRSFSGAVKFSDDGSVSSPVSLSDPAFRLAAAGGTDVRVLENSSPSQIRILEPVIAGANGRAIGVLEVYLPYAAIAAKSEAGTRVAITRLAVSLVGLFAVLALISWWTTRALRQSAAAHQHDALHDSLTGLPNRELFRRIAEDALTRGGDGEQGALVLIDLDHFKEVNDTLGHHAGDELLRVVARRLGESLRTDDTVARLGGDEFAMVLPGGRSREETVALLGRVRRELSEEVVLNGVPLRIEASFGVCFYPEGAKTVEDLLQHADAAMYQGKQLRGGVVIYEPSTPLHATHALARKRELRGALDRGELVVHYQPKITLDSGEVSCVEALVRWQHPERGLLLPADFLDVAERSDLIETLTSWVLLRALTDYRAWTAAGHDWTLAVNVSPRNLTSIDFADRVSQILHEAAVPPDRLHLEVSETALGLDTRMARQVIGALAERGISMSIDHFGKGFTSLSKLFATGVSELKIDRTLLADLPGNDKDRAIVRAVVDLGHSLGCVVTAQGVESQDVADALADAGCDQGQGFLWLRPSPWTEVAEVFGATTPTAASQASQTGIVADAGRTPAQTGSGSRRASR